MNAPIPLRADPGAMRAAAVTSLTRAALATGMDRVDTNYPERYPSDLTDAEWALRRRRTITAAILTAASA
jgi:hypothetical protein